MKNTAQGGVLWWWVFHPAIHPHEPHWSVNIVIILFVFDGQNSDCVLYANCISSRTVLLGGGLIAAHWFLFFTCIQSVLSARVLAKVATCDYSTSSLCHKLSSETPKRRRWRRWTVSDVEPIFALVVWSRQFHSFTPPSYCSHSDLFTTQHAAAASVNSPCSLCECHTRNFCLAQRAVLFDCFVEIKMFIQQTLK